MFTRPYQSKRFIVSIALSILITSTAWLSTQSNATQGIFSFLDAAPVPSQTTQNSITPPQLPSIQNATTQTAAITDADIIRVGISDNDMRKHEYPSTRLTATGAYQLINLATHHVLYEGRAYHPVTITVSKQGFFFREIPVKGPIQGPLELRPLNPDSSQVKILNITRRKQQPTYHGYLEITRGYSSPAKLSVVNVVRLQDYLKAVVPNELPPRYGYEAVKAQSVAARNYAVRPREKPWPQFDICDSQYCQVYFGSHTEHPAATQALHETHGLVALYDGRPILALYSSAHGGYSEDYEKSFSDSQSKQFPGTPIAYLRGKADILSQAQPYGDLTLEENARRFWTSKNVHDFDVKSPYHRWEKQWAYDHLIHSLNKQLIKTSDTPSTKNFLHPHLKQGQSIGALKRVTVTKRGKSGKAMEVVLETNRGPFIAQKEFVIRKIFAHGGRMLPSANVVFSHLTDQNGKLVALKAQGGGFGHGIGMSQLGASYLSSKATPFEHIIQHYYSGTAIGTLPISVGTIENTSPQKKETPASIITQPQRVRFFALNKQDSTPTLFIETNEDDPESVTVRINNHQLIIPSKTETTHKKTLTDGLFTNQLWAHHPTQKIRRALTIPQGLLQTGQTNTLILYPSRTQPSKPIKAWIELIAPNNNPLG